MLGAGGTTRDNARSLSSKVQSRELYWSLGLYCSSAIYYLCGMVKLLDFAGLGFLICKRASQVSLSCDENHLRHLFTDCLGLTLRNINKYLQSRSSSFRHSFSHLENKFLFSSVICRSDL